MRQYDERFPGASVLLFEPERDEYQMFFADIFSLGSRRHVVELAWLATRRDLRRRAQQLEPILRRHGMRIRSGVLEDVSTTIWQGVGMDPEGRRRPVSQGLDEALDRLETALGVSG